MGNNVFNFVGQIPLHPRFFFLFAEVANPLVGFVNVKTYLFAWSVHVFMVQEKVCFKVYSKLITTRKIIWLRFLSLSQLNLHIWVHKIVLLNFET